MALRGRAWVGVCAVVIAAALLGIQPTGAQAQVTPTCDASSYSLALQSLTGPPRADLVIRIAAKVPDCELPESLIAQVTLLPFKGAPPRTLTFGNVPAPGGVATVNLGRVPRLRRVQATVSFGAEVTLTDQAKTLLKPDLVLTRASTARSVLLGRPFFVVAIVRERTKDVGLTAVVTVSADGSALATQTVTVGARRRVVVQVPVSLSELGRIRLTVAVTPSAPVETTLKNNTRRTSVETTEFRLQESTTLAQSFAGYGGQFNHHVYAAISRSVGVTEDNVGDMERKMRALHPEFSRIFFNGTAFNDADRMQSFIRTVQLAQSTGTVINITWQGGALNVANGTIPKFANVLIDLVRNRGITNLRWLTLQNEPNRTKITKQAYEAQYRALDPYIQSIRGQVKYMGGDLVRGPDVGAPDQEAWFQYMATNMADILDAYSIHVFWDYWDTQKLVDRLTEVRAIVDALPESGRKPLYVAEYGVRGLRKFNDLPAGDPGVWEDGTPMARTNINALQHAWFDVLAAELGYVGTSKWDSYFGKYDNGTQAYFMIGSPANGWPLYPLYNLLQLFTSTVKRNWQVVAVDSVPDTSRILAAYLGQKKQLTVIGLDTVGAQLNTGTATTSSYTVAGFPPSKPVNLLVWNANADGLVAPRQKVDADSNGVVNVTIAQHSVFVLTTVRLG